MRNRQVYTWTYAFLFAIILTNLYAVYVYFRSHMRIYILITRMIDSLTARRNEKKKKKMRRRNKPKK